MQDSTQRQGQGPASNNTVAAGDVHINMQPSQNTGTAAAAAAAAGIKGHSSSSDLPDTAPAVPSVHLERFNSQHFWLDGTPFSQQATGPSTAVIAGVSSVSEAAAATADAPWQSGFEGLAFTASVPGRTSSGDDNLSAGSSKGSISPIRQHLLHRNRRTTAAAAAAASSRQQTPNRIYGIVQPRPADNNAPATFAWPFGAAAASTPGIRQVNSISNDQVLPPGFRNHDSTVTGAQGSPPAAAPAPAACAIKGNVQHSERSKCMWQAAGQRVLNMQRAAGNFAPGILQGLDVKRHNYDTYMTGLLQTPATITVADYSNDKMEITDDISNHNLANFLNQTKPAWSKVRWINVQGLSWDVIQTLAVAYDLHPLSVEDIVHIPQRIKADYYQDYLYTSVILVSLEHPSVLDESMLASEAVAAAAATRAATAAACRSNTTSVTAAAARSPSAVIRSSSAVAASMMRQRSMWGPERGAVQEERCKLHSLRTRLLKPSATRAALAAAKGSAAALSPMELMVEQASLFLFRDGTVISLFSSEGEGLARSILDRLRGSRTLLTDSEDASFLFNTILDAVVDHTLPVVQIYASRIAALESQVLLEKRPPARLTKELHLLGNDLKVLRRTLVPTQHLIHKLQTTRVDRDEPKRFLSPLTVVYLSDVLDHISTVVEDMNTLAEDAQDLIGLVFNTIAHHNNRSMQTLAVVSTIFLPITFIAGVYGTNFDQWFPEIHWEYGYVYFWGICMAVTVVFVAALRQMGMFTS